MIQLTRQQVREVDRLAQELLEMPSLILMENAGRNVAHVVLDLLEVELQLVTADAHVHVLCGGGNNGGDGYVAARHLANAGVNVRACAVVDPAGLKGDAEVNHRIAAHMGLVEPLHDEHAIAEAATELERAHVIVDALLGTGFEGEVREPMAMLIEQVNACRGEGDSGPRIIAVDVPSGLNCDTGEPAEATIAAHQTVTLIAAKRGFFAEGADAYLGEVIEADFGTPPWLIERVLREA